MVEASQWYSLISIGSSSLALLAAAYVVRKIPNRRAGDTFVLAMVFFVLAGIFAYLLRTSTLDYYGANSGPLAIARLFYFFHMLAIGFTASFIGQYFLGFEIMRRRLVNLFLQVSLLVVAIGVTTQVTEVYYIAPFGVVVKDRSAIVSLAVFATIFMATALAVLVRTLRRSTDSIVRKQALLMTAGVVIHGVGAESYAVSRITLNLYPPPFLTITAFAMAALFAVAVLRYRMFVVTPQKEQPVGVPRHFDLKAGRAYAIRERRPRLAFLAIAEAVRLGSLGLVITRRTPTGVRDDYDLQATPILWLTSAVGQNCVPPTNPELLERLGAEVVRLQAQSGVVRRGDGGDAHGDHEFRTGVVRRRRGRTASARAWRPDRRHRAQSQVHRRGRDHGEAARRGPGGNADLPGTRGATLRPDDGRVDRGSARVPRLAGDDEPTLPMRVLDRLCSRGAHRSTSSPVARRRFARGEQ